MRILTLNLFFAFFLLNSFPISAKGGPSTFNAGVDISGLRKTGTDTILLKVDNNLSSTTYTLEAYASGTLKAYLGRNGNLKIGAMTTASRTALTPSQGEIVFDTDLTAFYGYDGSSWAEIGSGGGTYNNTNTATYSANFVAGSNVTIVPAISGGVGTFTISASISGSGNDAISIQGTNVNNASPTATANQLIYDPNTAEYIASTPYHVQHINLASQGVWLAAGSNITIASSTDNGSTTFTITSSGGGGSGDATTIQGTAVNNASPTLSDTWIFDGAEWNLTPIFGNPMTTDGDIVYQNTGTATALAIGNTGDVLTVSALGFPEWAAPSAGGGTTTATPTFYNTSEIYIASDTSISSFTPKLNTSNSPTNNYIVAWNGTQLYYASGTGDLGLANQAAAGITAVNASDTPEIDMTASTVSASSTVSAVLIDGSIGESRLNIVNSPIDTYFLMTDGTNLIWAQATNTVTATQTFSETASPTALDTSEIDITISATNQVSGDLIDGSIGESRLNISNSPSTDYFLKYDGTGLVWAQATDTITATGTNTITATTSLALTGNSPAQGEFYLEQGTNITITEYTGASTTWVISSTGGSGGTTTASPTITNNDGYLSISDGGNNDFTIEVNETLPGFNANKLQGTSVSNASPTAGQLYWYNATSTALVPVTLTAGSNVTISATGENALTISSTAAGGNYATNTIHLSISPTSDGNGGTVSTTNQTVYLDPDSTQGVDFDDAAIPSSWDNTKPIRLALPLMTPDVAVATDVILQFRYQKIGSGTPKWRVGSYTIIATETVTLLATTSVQTVKLDNFILNSDNVSAEDLVFLQVYRIGDNANDLHADNLHFYTPKLEVPVQ